MKALHNQRNILFNKKLMTETSPLKERRIPVAIKPKKFKNKIQTLPKVMSE